MNKSFRVVFNKARGALMVVNEMTSSVQAKGTKTVIATAVATLMVASSAVAGDVITNSNLPSNLVTGADTTKLISGQGEKLDIQTNGSVGQLLEDLKKVQQTQGGKKEKLEALMNALGPHNGSTIITGVTGGWNLMDKQTAVTVGFADLILGNKLPKDMIKKLLGQFNYQSTLDSLGQGGYFGDQGNTFQVTGDTSIRIGGDEGANPLVLGVVGGDVYVSMSKAPATIQHEGTAEVNVYAGNVAGLVGGSVATVAGYQGEPGSVDVSITKTQLNLHDSANVGGFVAGGVAIAANQTDIVSSVSESTGVLIDTNPESGSLNGLVIGGMAGGLAVATGDASATVNNGKTSVIDVKNGEVLGLVGGGAALSGDITLGQGTFNNLLQKVIGTGSGTATSTSGDILINLSDKSATAAVLGGGVAFADASGNHKGKSTSTATSVTMNLDGKASLTVEEKGKLHNAAYTFFNKVKAKNVGIKDFAEFAGGVNVDGAHFGNLGGGFAFARGYFEDVSIEGKGSALADTTVETVTMNLKGGYNVATALGGMALGLDKGGNAGEEAAQTIATSKVKDAYLNIDGGENILVTAGGLAYATAKNGQNSHVKASALVDKAIVTVKGGTVDGLFGGGIAVDDTGSKITNASTVSNNIIINMNGGTINVANVDPITGIAHGVENGAPSLGSYVYQTAKLMSDEMGNVAILGGGMATGGQALAQADKVNILLDGGEVKGNIFAGGAATLGAKAEVKQSLVQVNGTKITGDIYGGGLSGSINNETFDDDYKTPSSTVKATTIALLKGELIGNAYLGGKTFADSAKVAVEEGEVILAKDFAFKGETIDGSGAQKSSLTVVGGYDFDPVESTENTTSRAAATAKPVTIVGFDDIKSDATVAGAIYDFGNKETTTVNGIFDFDSIANGSGNTMTLESGAVSVKGSAQNAFDVNKGVLALGTDANTADAIESMGLYEGDAALYFSGTVDLTNAQITVGETQKGGVAIGSNGMLIVDASVSKGDDTKNPVTTVTGQKVTSEEGAKLHFVNVADQGLVKVDTDIAAKDWTVDNVLFEVTEGADNTYSFTVVTDAGKLGELGLDGLNGDALADISRQDDAASGVIKDLLDQANTSIASGDMRHAKINAALNVAAAAGVQTAGIEGAMMGIDQVTKRASLTNVFSEGWTGFAEVTGTQLKFGGDRSALETKTKLGGIAVGGEYTMGDMTFGVLGNFGTGDVKGQGDNAGVKNDVDYYGIQGYAAKRIGQFNVVGQMGYLMTDNDITNGADQVKVDADVFTIGARGEMAMTINEAWSAVPYVGLNYLRVATDGYTTKTGFKVGDVDQNLVNMPIGIAVSGDCSTHAGWTVRPTVDVAYIHTFGDTDIDATTTVGKVNLGTALDVWSENVGRLNVGVEARKNNMAFGFNLGGAVGSTDYREVYGQINVKYLF